MLVRDIFVILSIMTEQEVSPENVFLKAVFNPRNWEIYSSRIKILSSPDPEYWHSVDFPVELSLELTNHCNLRCVMCPVPNLKRTRGFMDETLVKRVIADIAEESGFLFLPQGFGESLLHKQYGQLLRLAKMSGIHPVVVLTNGMLLDTEHISTLIDTADVIIVTIDGITAKTYESIRVKGKFETVTGNVEHFLRVRGDKNGPRLILRIIRMKETEAEVEEFRTFWSAKIGGCDLIQVAGFNDWTGSVIRRGAEGGRHERDRHPCRMLWKNLTVYHDGRVSPCCYDAEGELIVGDAFHQSLKEIWCGPSLKNLREMHLSRQFRKIPICFRCTNWL
ncbi:MAG: radical protein [Nitrospirae bacterium]|nr:radical protein [Nitrospirota bacterium]